ncbi:hypothetical protein BIW11_02445 [Tropilaelaps mercedesae]|uniref:Uncharacterized protein n=1 Tax=Tropilaelaps mercedesae TaxID=418985 RepID=A0A1V9Y2Y7_9ACAR|nr:hypothetical protein BIW11_02445 [Tropilaelaps mercedesae]
MSDSEEGGSRTTLELQNRDELLRHCKRQLLLLQRTKAKLDEHKKERANIESQLRSQLEEISQERDELRSKLDDSRVQQTRRIQELEARNVLLDGELRELQNASGTKRENPVDELSEATNELNLLREEKRELLEKIDSLESARDAALELEKRMVQASAPNEINAVDFATGTI